VKPDFSRSFAHFAGDVLQLVSDEVYEKHLQLSTRQAESQDSHSYHCATPDCAGWCSYDDDVNTFFCYMCHRLNCLTCRAVHDGINCLQYQRKLRAEKYKDPAAMLANSTLEVPAFLISGRFTKKGTVETLASQAEIGVWVQAPGTLLRGSGSITPGKVLRLYMQNPEIWCIFGRKMVRNAVHNAFFNSLTMGTPSHAFRQLFNNGNGVPTRSPRNDPNFLNPIVVCCATNCPARMGGRTFSVAARPSIWNSLADYLCDAAPELNSFLALVKDILIVIFKQFIRVFFFCYENAE